MEACAFPIDFKENRHSKWRWRQSAANRSLVRIPCLGGKYREKWHFAPVPAPPEREYPAGSSHFLG
jgi:hypothetical protein